MHSVMTYRGIARSMRHSSVRPLLFLLALGALFFGAAQRTWAQSSPFTPSSLNFGSVEIGSASMLSFDYLSSDQNELTIHFSSDNSAFSVTPLSTNSIFNEGVMATVTFRPRTVGPTTGNIIVEADVLAGEFTVRQLVGMVPVQGIGTAPFNINPTSLTFPPTPLGQTSAAQQFRVSLPNAVEGMALDFSVSSGNPNAFQPTPALFTLLPGESQLVDVTFSPVTAGETQSAIIVSGGGANIPVDVTGEGIAITVDPLELTLPPTLTGCGSDAQLTVIPTLTADVLLGPADRRFSASPTQFIASSPTTVIVSIAQAPAGTTMTNVIVNARERGRPAQQVLVPTTATGISVLPDPTSLSFGAVTVGSTSATLSIQIDTSLPAMIQTTALSDNPAFEIVSAEGGLVQVAFSPTAEGLASGTVTIQAFTDADPECMRPITIPVSGTGQALGLRLDPLSLDFGETPTRGGNTLRANLINESDVDFQAAALSSQPAFTVGMPAFSVPANSSVPVDVTFSPTQDGPASGQVTFQLTAMGLNPTDLLLPVSGTGVTAALTYSAVIGGSTSPVIPGGTIQAPSVVVGGSSTFVVVATNPGTSPATIASIGVTGDAFGPQVFEAVVRTVAPGESFSLPLTFDPAALGRSTGELRLGTATFALSGVGLLGGGSITGWPGGVQALQQLSVGVALDDPALTDVSGLLTLTYAPDDSLPADPNVVFANGANTVAFTIPMGQTQATFMGGSQTVGLQTGSVAGVITLSATFDAGLAAVTPAAGVFVSSPVASSAPVITSVTITNATGSGFTVVARGLTTTRAITQMQVTLSPRGAVDLATPTVTVSGIGEAFATYFAGQTEFGGQFQVSVPFNVSGATNAIGSVSVTMSNASGTSAAVSANLP